MPNRSPFWPWVGAWMLLCLLVMAACGGSSAAPTLPPPPDPFFVTGSTPEAGATDVEPDGIVEIAFSGAPNLSTLTPDTVAATVEGDPAAVVIGAGDDANAVQIALGGVLPPGGAVVLQLDPTAIRNVEGTLLDPARGPIEIAFTLLQAEQEIPGGGGIPALDGRTLASQAVLEDGRLLIAGGLDAAGVVRTDAELVAPDTGNRTATGDLQQGRWGHGAGRLPDGRILVAGGFLDADGTTATGSCELYDPAAETFAATGALTVPRAAFTLARSSDAILVALGGSTGYGGAATTGTVEAWDSIGQTFVPLAATLPVATTDMAVAALGDGFLLVAGGADDVGTVLSTAHLLHPVEDEIETTGALLTARRAAGAVRMATGEVLVAGGIGAGGAMLDSIEIYDPATGLFRASAATLAQARAHARVVALANGAVAIVGGVLDGAGTGSTAIDVYDPTTDARIATYTLAAPRVGANVAALPDGKLLIAYGARGSTLPPDNVDNVIRLAQGVLGATIEAPRVVGTTPQPSDTGIDVDARITARLSKAIDPTTIANAFTVTDEEGRAVTGTVGTEAGDTVLVFVPDAPLGVRQTISVEVATTVADLLGNDLADDAARTWSFTTTYDLLIGALDNGSQFGACTRAGDINGDGYDDIVVSAYVAESTPGSGNKEGQVYVIFGRADWGPENAPATRDLSTAAGAPDLIITGESAGDQLGMESSVGIADINGDGYDDIVIGAHFADGPTEADSSRGEFYVVFGQATFSSSTLQLGNSAVSGFNVLRIYGAAAGDKVAESFAFGDVDGDGTTDIVLSATGVDADATDTNTGAMYVVFGDTLANLGVINGYGEDVIGSAATTVANLEILGEEKNDRLAWTVGCGDIDGDGYDDIVGGATGADGPGNAYSSAGDVIVVFGAARSTLIASGIHEAHRAGSGMALAGCVIQGEAQADFTGWYVDVADLDGDTYADVAIGARSADGTQDAQSNAGEVSVLFGAPRATWVTGGAWTTHALSATMSGPTLLRLGGENASDNAGDAVLIADVDGDGNRDLLVGTTGGRNPQNTGNSNVGEIAVLRGSLRPTTSPREYAIGNGSVPAGVTLTRFYGRAASDRWGTTLAVGDFNGDGYPDLLTGANLATGLGRLFSNAGEAYVLWGRATWWK